MEASLKKVNPRWLSLIPANSLIAEKVLRSGFCVVFILETGEIISPYFNRNQWSSEIEAIARAWKNIHALSLDFQDEIDSLTMLIDSFGEKDAEIGDPFSQRVRHLTGDVSGTVFFALLDNGGKFPVYSFFRKIHFQQIRNGRFPIHASGIVYRNSLFLFGGPSGIGKSTISKLCTHHGAQVLDEDQLLLKKLDGTFSADAWGYGLIECSQPLRGIFQLYQSEENRLVRLNKPQTSRFLISQMFDAVGNELPEDVIRAIARRSSEITRAVPGYQLHFRKSPDFWHLLELEFQLE